MTIPTVKEWLDIINRDIENETKFQTITMSKIGSALMIEGVLIWFTYSNFFANKANLSVDIIELSAIVNFFQFFLLFILIGYYFNTKNIKYRLASNLTVLKKYIIKKLGVYVILLLFVIVTLLNLYYFRTIRIYASYFIIGILIDIMFGILIWIMILLNMSILDCQAYLCNIKFEIISGKLTDVEKIRQRYLATGYIEYKEELETDNQ